MIVDSVRKKRSRMSIKNQFIYIKCILLNVSHTRQFYSLRITQTMPIVTISIPPIYFLKFNFCPSLLFHVPNLLNPVNSFFLKVFTIFKKLFV